MHLAHSLPSPVYIDLRPKVMLRSLRYSSNEDISKPHLTSSSTLKHQNIMDPNLAQSLLSSPPTAQPQIPAAGPSNITNVPQNTANASQTTTALSPGSNRSAPLPTNRPSASQPMSAFPPPPIGPLVPPPGHPRSPYGPYFDPFQPYRRACLLHGMHLCALCENPSNRTYGKSVGLCCRVM